MKALILVDLQNDFMPGGALAVPDGDHVVPIANALVSKFELVVATQDWHPPDHASFASQHPGTEVGQVIELDGAAQVLWPDHCVQGTPGAEFHAALDFAAIDHVVRKGTDRRIDSYSGFFDNNHKKATGLADDLKKYDVDDVFIMGLATDYCVKFTALDARELGLSTTLIKDGCRGVNLAPGDAAQAIQDLEEAGVRMMESAELLK